LSNHADFQGFPAAATADFPALAADVLDRCEILARESEAPAASTLG